MKNVKLAIITARGGSKGIPGKNKKLLGGKPLVAWSIDMAKRFLEPEKICVTTDDPDIFEIARERGCPPPFVRPAELAQDATGSYEVILHAIDFYESRGLVDFSDERAAILLFQPTSPFRAETQVREAVALYDAEIEKRPLDMVVSVRRAATNPYYACYEDGEDGFLVRSKGDGRWTRRQDVPPAWEHNGAIYVMNVAALKRGPIFRFRRQLKYEMDDLSSLDLDTPLDWDFAEFLISRGALEKEIP